MKLRRFIALGLCWLLIGAPVFDIQAAVAQTDSALGTPAPSPARVAPRRNRRARANRVNRIIGLPGNGANAAAAKTLPRGAPAAGPATAGPIGPLSPLGKRLEDAGIQIHLDEIDAFYQSLGVGVQTTNSNTGIFVAGVDFDLGRIADLNGSSVHFQEYIFHAQDRNHLNAGAAKFADLNAAYQPIYNPTDNQLEVLTFEQKSPDGRLDVEVGRSNFYRAFALPVCADAPCFNYVLQLDARLLPSTIGQYSGRALYKITPDFFVQAGLYEDDPQATQEHGFEFNAQRATGVVGVAELGYKTDYSTTKYPGRYELIGYYNTSTVADPYRTVAGTPQLFNPGLAPLTHQGNAGIVAQGQQTVYRFDRGLTDNPTPTALVAFATASAPFTSGSLVSFDGRAGVTLTAPLQSRPFDTLSLMVQVTQLSGLEQAFLQSGNIVAGGTGYFKSRNEVNIELNAHIQVDKYVGIDPKIEYFANANNFFNPVSSRVSRDGFLFAVAAVVPLGQLLGLSSLPF